MAKQAGDSAGQDEESLLIRLFGAPNKAGQVRAFARAVVEAGGRGVRLHSMTCASINAVICVACHLTCPVALSRTILKDVVFACKEVGMDVQYERGNVAATFEGGRPGSGGDEGSDDSLAGSESERRAGAMVVTVVQQPNMDPALLSSALQVLSRNGCNIRKIRNMTSGRLGALELRVESHAICDDEGPAATALFNQVQSQLLLLSRVHSADLALQWDSVLRYGRRLVVFDMDSTLIQMEVIDELARHAGKEAEVSEITEKAMRGEMDFAQSLAARCAMLKGQKADEVFERTIEVISQNFTPGAKLLCHTLHSMGLKTAVVSGGFLPCAQYVQQELQLDYVFANELEEDAQGRLTGRTRGPIVTPNRKSQLLSMIASVENATLAQCVAVGDGANDIPMLQKAGLGIAFCAKPKVQAEAHVTINHLDLGAVLYLLGVAEGEGSVA